MPRFFVEPENVNNDIITLYGDDAKHVCRVLRSKEGDVLTVCDSRGNDYEAEIVKLAEDDIKLKIINQSYTKSEPKLKITLYQSLPKADKMETIIQKCVELGIFKIVPVNTQRCIVKLDKNKEKKKIDRWQKISESAAKQSGRGIIPEIGDVVDFSEALMDVVKLDAAIIPYELEQDRSLKIFLDEFKGESLGIFIGPEGGFSSEEINSAVECSVIPLTLGKRILRTETAGMMVLSNSLFYLDM